MTSHKTRFEDNQQLIARLQQVELAYQMASEMSQFKAGFLARTSHELRSPLNGMIGMLQLILADLCDGPEEERDFTAQANVAALKMVKILDSLLEVSKFEHGTSKLEIQPIQLTQLFEEVYILTHLQAQNRNLRLHLIPPDSELYILADPRRLTQVLVNLIDNAITQKQEGEITISTQVSVESGCVHIWIDDQRPANTWSEPFDLLKSDLPAHVEVPSPGLNLLVNQTLLELMQGRLEVETTSSPDPHLSGSTTDSLIPLTRIQCSLPLLVPEAD